MCWLAFDDLQPIFEELLDGGFLAGLCLDANQQCDGDHGISSSFHAAWGIRHLQLAIGLQHWQRAARTARERGIDPGDLGAGQKQAGRPGILFDVIDTGRFGDCEHRRPQREKC
jgi:hypothetical protein